MKKIFQLATFLLLSTTTFIWSSQSFRFDTVTIKQLQQLHSNAVQECKRKFLIWKKIPLNQRNKENTIVALDTLFSDLWRFGRRVYLLSAVHPKKDIRRAALAIVTRLQQFDNQLSHDPDMYTIFSQFAKSKSGKMLRGEYRKFLLDTLKELLRSGLALPAIKLLEVKKIRNKLNLLATRFSRNIREDTSFLLLDSSKVAGLPEDYLARRKQKNGLYKIDLSYPSLGPFLEHAKHVPSRKRLLELYFNRAKKKNKSILLKMLRLRLLLAQKLGYKNYADYVLENRMAKNYNQVRLFLDKLLPGLKRLAAKDIALLSKLKQKDGYKGRLQRWDIGYYSNKARKQFLQFDARKLRPYFSLKNCLHGLFKITGALFNLQYKKVSIPKVWHKDVLHYQVYDKKSKKLLGYFYLDLFPRPGKYSHAAMFSLQARKVLHSGKIRKPIFALVCNFPRPGKTATLLAHRQVVTLFHEFGHGLHCLLSKTKLTSFAGTAVERDFVETPSQMLENWAYEPQILKLFARHYKTGVLLPSSFMKKINRARRFLVGYRNLTQLFLSIYDMRLHQTTKPVSDSSKLYWRLYSRLTGMPGMLNSSPEASFGHLVGYAAGYYGYLWAKVYAQDFFSVFKKVGLLNAQLGQRYRRTVLAKGGSVTARQLLRDFLKRKPSNKAFLNSLGLQN